MRTGVGARAACVRPRAARVKKSFAARRAPASPRARVTPPPASPRARMRVVSFDVGTRNFAVCVVETAPEAPGARIRHWEVIDVVAEQGVPPKANIEEKKCGLLRALEARRGALAEGLGEGDAVVIEQQPFGRGHGSPTMNILAHVIGSFFVLAAPAARPAYAVRQVAARTKLGVAPEDWGGAPLPSAPPDAPAEGASWRTWVAAGAPAVCVGDDVLRRTGAVHALHAAAGEPPRLALTFARARKSAASAAKALGVPAAAFEPWRGAGPPLPAGCAEYGADPAARPGAKRRREAEHRRYKVNKGHSVEVARSVLAGPLGAEGPWRERFAASKKQDDLADALTQALSQATPVPT